VLVVDDESIVLGLVSNALSRRGYQVHAASTPQEALEMVRDLPCFDVMVSDVIMPEMCGPELVRRVILICPNVAIVLISGFITAEALPEGAAFVSKPFALTDLYEAVEKVLALSGFRA
jgi:two-component system cell cycle sensor histidine kinase/response regulator CckA